MRRWRRRGNDEEVLTFDDMVEADDEERVPPPRRRYAPPRPFRTMFADEDGIGDDDESEGPTFEDLEPMIRAGSYKPKQSDPWTAHVLYQSLLDLGEIS